MAQFSISDAAFTGFGVVRHRPRAVAIWIVAQVIVSVGFSLVLATQFGSTISQLAAMGPNPPTDPAQLMALGRQLLPLYGALLAFSLVYYPILFSTMNRAVLRPNDDRIGYIRLGPDEFRQLGLVVIFALVAFAALFVLAFVGALVGSLISAALQQPALAPLILIGVVIAGFTFLAVRLSLASAQTFATQKISVFGSWALTKDRFPPLFAAYLLSSILFVIVFLLGYIVIVMIIGAMGGAKDLTQVVAQAHDTTTLFSPTRIVEAVLRSVLSAIASPILMMPAPAIYRAIVGDGASPADVF